MEKFNMFEFLSKDNKELIHSQFIKYLLTYYKTDFIAFLGINPIEGTIEMEKQFTLKRKEKVRFDLIMTENNNITFVLENKFKSFPGSDQIEKYNTFFKKKNIPKVLLSFDNEISKNLIPDSNWIFKDYKELLDFCKSINGKDQNESERAIFLKQYIDFLQKYVDDFQSIGNNDLQTIITKKPQNAGFWTSLAYYVIISKLSTKVSSGSCSVFYGRQYTPGFNIWNKHFANRFTFEGNGCWFEYQNNEFKLKFAKESIRNYDLLKDNANIGNGYTFCKKRPNSKSKSFTLIRKRIELNNIEQLVNNVANEYFDLREKLQIHS